MCNRLALYMILKKSEKCSEQVKSEGWHFSEILLSSQDHLIIVICQGGPIFNYINKAALTIRFEAPLTEPK